MARPAVEHYIYYGLLQLSSSGGGEILSRSTAVFVALVAVALALQPSLMAVGVAMWPIATAGDVTPTPSALAVDFTISPTQSAPGDPVVFSGTASGGTPPYTFSWMFGDGGVETGTGSQHTVTHTYSAAGTFTANLTVTDPTPLQTGTKLKQIVVAPLVADFSFPPTNPVAGQTVTFSGTATGGTPPYTFTWAWGDGTPAGSGQTVGHAFASPGTFTVMLTVRDSASPPPNEASRSRTVAVTPAPLTAGFTFSPTNPIVAQTVMFSATASGGTQPYTFDWAFGDGLLGGGQTVNHVYGSAGNFTVTLTVSDDGSPSQVVTPFKIVNVMGADFTFSPASPSANQPVTFSASVTGGTPGYTFTWAFGDGKTGSGQKVTHTYTSGGSYTVTLTARDSAARVVTVSKVVPVASVIAADFTFSPTAPAVGDVVTFRASATGGTPPYTYTWTFGDGGGGVGQVVNRTYSSPGSFTVILTLTDIASPPRSTVVSKTIVVTPALTASFTFTPTNPVVGEPVNFSANATGGTSTSPYTISWTFGDSGTASGRTPGHTYATAGNFTVNLTVSDSVGHTVTVSRSVPVTPLLRADFTFLPQDPVVGEDVYFTGTATGGTGPYEYRWSFGDGSTGIGFGPAHEYASVGSFTVNLTVSDSAGHTTTVRKPIAVRAALATDLTVSQDRPVTREVITFSANATGGSPPYAYVWEFGDGSNATRQSIFHAYLSSGSFEVTVTVSDTRGRRGVADTVIEVTEPLTINFTSDPPNRAVGERMFLDATVDGGTAPYNFTWAFGDGATGAGQRVPHVYASPGNFTVTLTVSDSATHRTALSKPIPVASPLSARAAFSPSKPAVGQPITFSGNATGGTPPYRYSWTFGDSEAGSGATVSHFYINASAFNVTLKVTDAMGRFVVVVIVVFATTNLAVDFTFDPGFPIPGRPITFVPILSGGTPPYAYTWTFGDGSESDEERPTHLYAGTDLTATYRVGLEVCDSEALCVSASKDVTLVDWPQVANIGVGIAIVSVVALWLVRRHRARELNVKSAGRWAWRRGSGIARGIVGRVRGLRNGRDR